MSNMKRNFYDILNATSNATTDELKSNYKQLILQCHPDKLLQQQGKLHDNTDTLVADDPNNAEFLAIKEAWNCLKDPIKRKQYDAELLLNKFHTHNNIYAHIKLSEMKKQLNTEAADTDDDNDEVKVQEEVLCNTSKYFYTYDCRCGGQYIVDESAQQYCRIGNYGCQTRNNDNNNVDYNNGVDDDDDAGRQNNKSSPANNIKYKNNAGDGDGGGVGEGVIFNKDNGDDDDEGGELIVECNECSLVIILNG